MQALNACDVGDHSYAMWMITPCMRSHGDNAKCTIAMTRADAVAKVLKEPEEPEGGCGCMSEGELEGA
eukprot:2837305-Rhodomonas_salina.1